MADRRMSMAQENENLRLKVENLELKMENMQLQRDQASRSLEAENQALKSQITVTKLRDQLTKSDEEKNRMLSMGRQVLNQVYGDPDINMPGTSMSPCHKCTELQLVTRPEPACHHASIRLVTVYRPRLKSSAFWKALRSTS